MTKSFYATRLLPSVLVLAVVALPSSGSDRSPNSKPAAVSEASGTMLTVIPEIPFVQGTLRVYGPGGYEAIAWSEGEPLRMDLLASGTISASDGRSGGEPAILPDGSYSYEMVLYPGDGSRTSHGGAFAVENGVVRPPRPREREDRSVAASSPVENVADGITSVSAAGTITNDHVVINDDQMDGETLVQLKSSTAPEDQGEDFFLENDGGRFYVSNVHATSHPILSVVPTDTVDGRVGVGTPFPGADLHIFNPGGNIRITDADMCPNPNAAWEIEEDFGRLRFEVVSNCPGDAVGGKMWIHGNGNVGIGTSDPQAKLHLTAPTVTNTIRLQAGSGVRDLTTLDDGGFELKTGTGTRNIRIFPTAPDNSLVLHPYGVGIGTGSPTAKLHVVGNGIIEGDVALGSSRTIKHEIEPLDPAEMLQAIRGLPLYVWKYVEDPVQAAHVGPMAEDVHGIFELGRDEKHLSPADSAGLALAGVQGVDRRVAELEALVAALASRNDALAAENGSLEQRLEAIERRLEAGSSGDD